MVSIKHKVTIKTKTAQEEAPVAVGAPKVAIKPKQPETPQTPPEKSKGGSIAWIWIAVLVIVAVFAFFCFKNCRNNEKDNFEEGAGVPPTEKIDSAENKETLEATAGDDAKNAEESVDNVGSDSSGKASNTPEKPKAGTDYCNKVAPAVQEPEKNETPASVKQEKKQTSTSIGTVSHPTAHVSGDLEETARQVIRGVFGNGQERKDKLGSAYSEIQERVNEMYRQGLVH